MIRLSFWLCTSAIASGALTGRGSPSEDDDDAASRALEAAIMGLPKDSSAVQQRQLTEAEDALLAEKPKLRKQPKQRKQPKKPQSKHLHRAQPMSERTEVIKFSEKQYPPGVAPVTPTAAPYSAPPLDQAPVAPPVTAAPVALAVPLTTAAPVVAQVVTAAPPLAATDLGAWKMQMESKLHVGLSSEIKILNTLMAHQTKTHQQLLKFKQVLTVLGTKYKAQETVTQQQQTKIQSLEAQVASLNQQVHTLNTKFNAYKQQHEQKWQGSQTAIDDLYKKASDAFGAMTAVHESVQKELNAQTLPALNPGTVVQNATAALAPLASPPSAPPPTYSP